MAQIYRAEYRLAILEVDMGASVNMKKKELYVDAVKKLIDLGVTDFSAKFTYCDPRYFSPKNSYEHALRERLFESREVSLLWEFKYLAEHYIIVVDRLNSRIEVPIVKIIILKISEDGARAKIDEYTILSRDLSDHLIMLKLQYGDNSGIKYMQ